MGKTRAGLKYQPKDSFYHEAKKRGFVARSALKLEELDRKFKIYKPAMHIFDLGCAPGSWLQYASRRAGPKSRLIGVDLDVVRVSLPNVETWQGDLLELEIDNEKFNALKPFDLFQSDAMIKTTGIGEADCARSIALVEHALELAVQGLLRPGGTFLAKVFEGPGFTEFYVAFKRLFKKCSVTKPDATRKGSREVYVIGQDFRGL